MELDEDEDEVVAGGQALDPTVFLDRGVFQGILSDCPNQKPPGPLCLSTCAVLLRAL